MLKPTLALVLLSAFAFGASAQTTAQRFTSFEEARKAVPDADCYVGLETSKHFSTLEMAAVWSLGRLMHEAGKTGWDKPKPEYAGYVLESDGHFIVSVPVTQGNESEVSLGCIVFLPGSKLAGIFHTHPADPGVSPADKRQAERLRVPSFIGTLTDGMVVSYDPSTRETKTVGTIDASDVEAMRFVRMNPR
jgi:hypothetical protein